MQRDSRADNPNRRRSITAPNYLFRANLERALIKKINSLQVQFEESSRRSTWTILDLGSGGRLYEELFPGQRYFALDISSLDKPHIIATGEELPLAASCFDFVLCIQVLEHVSRPERVLSEIARVLKPGGMVLLSTHGTMFYHPTPLDYWRWTQAGLAKMFENQGTFEDLLIEPVQGTFSTLGFFLAWYTHLLLFAAGTRLGPLQIAARLLESALVGTINMTSKIMDKLLPQFGRIDSSNTLFGVFLVQATRCRLAETGSKSSLLSD